VIPLGLGRVAPPIISPPPLISVGKIKDPHFSRGGMANKLTIP